MRALAGSSVARYLNLVPRFRYRPRYRDTAGYRDTEYCNKNTKKCFGKLGCNLPLYVWIPQNYLWLQIMIISNCSFPGCRSRYQIQNLFVEGRQCLAWPRKNRLAIKHKLAVFHVYASYGQPSYNWQVLGFSILQLLAWEKGENILASIEGVYSFHSQQQHWGCNW